MTRLPSLSDYDMSNFDDYETGQNSGKKNPNPPPLPVRSGVRAALSIGSPYCWCGQPMGHDWPGKDDKAPHPR